MAAVVPAVNATPARHLRLVKSEPADSTSLTTAPADIKLWFSEDPQLAVTRVYLTQAKDTIALAALTRAKEPKSPIVARVVGKIVPGAYVVDWRTMGTDGHVLKGTFKFKVANAATQ